MARTPTRAPSSLMLLAALTAACTKPAEPTSTPEPTSAAAPEAAAPAAIDADVDAVVALMAGSFSSREQALRDPSYFDIRLHMIPLWTDRDDARWLYVEQAVAAAQDKPYRQRVYRVSKRDDGAIVSAVYTMEAPERFTFAWREPGKLDALAETDIALKDGCEVVLEEIEPGRYSGATGDRTCKSDLRGASYATSQVTVSEQGVDSWDRGFDDAGEQVWGATAGGYEFRKGDPEAPPAEPPKKDESGGS